MSRAVVIDRSVRGSTVKVPSPLLGRANGVRAGMTHGMCGPRAPQALVLVLIVYALGVVDCGGDAIILVLRAAHCFPP